MSEQDSITFFFKKPSFHLSFKFYIEYKRIKKSLIMYFNICLKSLFKKHKINMFFVINTIQTILINQPSPISLAPHHHLKTPVLTTSMFHSMHFSMKTLRFRSF